MLFDRDDYTSAEADIESIEFSIFDNESDAAKKFKEKVAEKKAEPLDEWGQGDSIADLYAKSGAVVSQVSSAKDLLTFLQSAGTTRHF